MFLTAANTQAVRLNLYTLLPPSSTFNTGFPVGLQLSPPPSPTRNVQAPGLLHFARLQCLTLLLINDPHLELRPIFPPLSFLLQISSLRHSVHDNIDLLTNGRYIRAHIHLVSDSSQIYLLVNLKLLNFRPHTEPNDVVVTGTFDNVRT